MSKPYSSLADDVYALGEDLETAEARVKELEKIVDEQSDRIKELEEIEWMYNQLQK